MGGPDQYLIQKVTTASPAELVAMMLDAAVARSLAAAEALEEGRHLAATEQLVRAQRLVAELRVCLDHERGGEIASNLELIYEFAHRRLLDASRSSDPVAAREAARAVTPIRDGWRETFLAAAPRTGVAT